MNNENLKNTCGNCNKCNKTNQKINRSYVCEYLGKTTNTNSIECYKIQISKIK